MVVDPIEAGGRTTGLYAVFPRNLHEDGPSRVIPLDLGKGLDDPVAGSAKPALSTNFIRLRPGEPVATHATATAEFYFVLRGHGRSRAGDQATEWQRGDSFFLPSGQTAVHVASEDSALFWLHDEPWLGAGDARTRPPRFEPPFVRAEGRNVAPTDEASDPGAGPRSFRRVLPAIRARELSFFDPAAIRGSSFEVPPGGQSRPPQRTRSTTLHLVIDGQPGCSTLVGRRLDGRGRIIDPVRIDWEPSSAMVKPPETWFVHVNKSRSKAHLLPVEIPDLRSSADGPAQDAGWQSPGSPFNFKSPLGRRGT